MAAMKSFVRISSLLWAEIFVNFALFVMQDYLTKVWNLDVTRAAAILNIWGAIAKILPLILLLLLDSSTGNFWMLTFSSILCSAGIGFIALSTPSLLGGPTHACEKFEPQCIGHVEKSIFYAGMVLINVGKAGHSVSLKPFLEDQNGEASLSQIVGIILVLIVALAGAIGLPYVKAWSIRFGIPAIVTILATVLYLTGWCKYERYGPQRTINYDDAKTAFRLVPMLFTFVVCGIVSSTSNTYFVQQASNMNRKIGNWSVPQNIFLLMIEGARQSLIALTYHLYLRGSRRRYAPSVGVAYAMILGVLCCIAAAKVETMRLNVIRVHNLMEKPDETIPMSMFWLSFQFVLIGGLTSVLDLSTSELYRDQWPESMSGLLDSLGSAVTGLGFVCAVGVVDVVGRVSGRDGRISWFQETLNKSRLDNYYWTLAVLGSANLLVFSVAACCFKYNSRRPMNDNIGRP